MKRYATPTVIALSLGLFVGCASESEPTGETETQQRPWATISGKGDLPNDSIYHREHDRSGYRDIAERFAEEGFDLTVDKSAFSAEWPMDDEHTAVLNRFGTPILFSYMGYLHSAFDVYRSDIHGNDAVHAPVSGTLRVFDWWGEPGYNDRPYSTVVAIYDPNSHLIVQLMHVEPTDQLKETGEAEVEAGEVIGRLAADLTWLEGDDLERFRHTHVNVIDGENMVVLDPAQYLPYRDSVAPRVLDGYLLDEEATPHRDLSSGQFDVVLDLADRDDADLANLEIGSVAYEITDNAGKVLLQSERCEIDHMIDSLDFEAVDENDPSTKFMDYGSGYWQYRYGAWKQTDFDFTERSFRYALTQLRADENGRCHTMPDEEGFIEVSDEVEAVHVMATIWDQSDNATEFELTFRRDTDLDAGRLVINEVLANPPADYDANQDGVFDARQDEFVELVNSTDEALSLAGYTLRDDKRTRFEFGDVTIEPGAALVVFGGGEPDIRTRAQTLTAGTLGLNNDGDHIALFDATGNLVDELTFSKEEAGGGSMTRCADGDRHGRFVPHPEQPASPGLMNNREQF